MLKPKQFLKSPSLDIQTVISDNVLLWKHQNEVKISPNYGSISSFVIRQVKSPVSHLHVQQTWD